MKENYNKQTGRTDEIRDLPQRLRVDEEGSPKLQWIGPLTGEPGGDASIEPGHQASFSGGTMDAQPGGRGIEPVSRTQAMELPTQQEQEAWAEENAMKYDSHGHLPPEEEAAIRAKGGSAWKPQIYHNSIENSILKIMKYGSTIKPSEVGMTKRNSMQDIDKANGASGGQVSEATRLEEQGGGGESWYGPGMGTATSAATGAIDTALHGLTGGWSTPTEKPGMTPEETAAAAGKGAAEALAQNQQQPQAGTNGASPAGGGTGGEESVIPSTFQLPSSNGDKTTQPSIPGVNGNKATTQPSIPGVDGNKTDANISNPFSPPGGGAAGGENIPNAFSSTPKLNQGFTGQPTKSISKKSLSKDGDHGSSYLRSLSKPTVGGAASGKLTDVGA